MADMDEIATLLHIYEKAVAHGDALPNIKQQVWAKLKAIDAEHGQWLAEGKEDLGPEEEETEHDA